jgi:hypothetical protein
MSKINIHIKLKNNGKKTPSGFEPITLSAHDLRSNRQAIRPLIFLD